MIFGGLLAIFLSPQGLSKSTLRKYAMLIRLADPSCAELLSATKQSIRTQRPLLVDIWV
jgi:hypothetical protein